MTTDHQMLIVSEQEMRIGTYSLHKSLITWLVEATTNISLRMNWAGWLLCSIRMLASQSWYKSWRCSGVPRLQPVCCHGEEVSQAVKDAWMHARVQMHNSQSISLTVIPVRDLPTVLYPLHKGCQTLLRDLWSMRSVPVNDFAQQVIERHIH